MRSGHKHLIECRCILRQFQKMHDPPLHKFVVFSEFDDDEIIPRLVQCNNCGIVHRVVDICKSEIVQGKESANSIMTVEDVRSNVPEDLRNILDSYDVDIATWEAARFIVDNERWGDYVVLSSDNANDIRQGKYVRILGKTLYKIDSFSSGEILSLK